MIDKRHLLAVVVARLIWRQVHSRIGLINLTIRQKEAMVLSMTRVLTTFLFALPRFTFGMARALDLGANFDGYNISRIPAEADTKALLSDWYIVSDDLLNAMQEVDSKGCGSYGQEETASAVREIPAR